VFDYEFEGRTAATGLCSAVPTPEREKKMLICVARAHELMLRAQSLGTDQALNEVIAQAQFATALLDPRERAGSRPVCEHFDLALQKRGLNTRF
jgi:hypothetical protein